MIDVSCCIIMYFHYLVFLCVVFKRIVSNTSILGDVSIVKKVSSASD